MTREEAIKILTEIQTQHKKYIGQTECNNALNMAIEALQQEPIVHCKDCKHYIPSEGIPHEGWCDDALQNLFKEDFYCSFGERREPCA